MNQRWILFSLLLLGLFFLFVQFFKSPKPSDRTLASDRSADRRSSRAAAERAPDSNPPSAHGGIPRASASEEPWNSRALPSINSHSQQMAVASPAEKSGKYAVQMKENQPSIQDEIRRQEEVLHQNSTALRIQLSDQEYVLTKLRASKSPTRSSINQLFGHEIYPLDQTQAEKALIEDDSYSVVYNPSSGRMGFLTGVILFQAKDRNEGWVRNFISRFPLELLTFDSSIGLATLKVKKGESFLHVFKQLKASHFEGEISPEVFESYKGF
jgi:hypothetical protein